MIVILDTAAGKAYNFRTRKEAGEFIGVSLPTLRGWLAEPFFLHKTLIITNTSNEKVRNSNRALLKKTIRNYSRMERAEPVHGIQHKVGILPINGPRSEQPAEVAPLPIQTGEPVFTNNSPNPTQ